MPSSRAVPASDSRVREPRPLASRRVRPRTTLAASSWPTQWSTMMFCTTPGSAGVLAFARRMLSCSSPELTNTVESNPRRRAHGPLQP